MDKKTIIAVAIAALVTFFVTSFLRGGQSVVEAGLDAQTEAAIRLVLREEMVLDLNGETKTYGQALSWIAAEQVKTTTRLNSMEKALLALSAE